MKINHKLSKEYDYFRPDLKLMSVIITVLTMILLLLILFMIYFTMTENLIESSFTHVALRTSVLCLSLINGPLLIYFFGLRFQIRNLLSKSEISSIKDLEKTIKKLYKWKERSAINGKYARRRDILDNCINYYKELLEEKQKY